MKKTFLILLIIWNICLHSQTVKLAAAGNLRYILEEIKNKYSLINPRAEIIVNLGASGALCQQIINGAGFDIYMSADRIYPDKLKVLGMITGEVKTYAFGKLVIWSNTVDVTKGLDIITDKSVNRIAIAKPEVAPYGDRAVECLKYYNLFDKVKDKIVYADNITQVAQFVQTGNAEIGFLALALAMSPDMKGSYFIVDSKSYKPVEQAIAMIKNTRINTEAINFMNYILGADCKIIFEKYGFIVP